MKKISFIHSALCLAVFSALNLTACNNYYFDSSIPPEEQQAIVENIESKQNIKTVKKSKKTAKKTTAKATETSSVQAGVIKPYVADEPVKTDTQGTLLPTIEGLKSKENKSSLSNVTIKDVVNGNVNLNELNRQDSASNQNSNSTLKLPENSAFTLDDNASDNSLNHMQNLKDTNAETQPDEIEILNTQDNALSSLSVSSKNKKCGSINTADASATAYEIVKAQALRLHNETGPIYIAPTVIPDDLTDCLTDLSGSIRQALAQSGIQTVSSKGIAVSQNSGSSSMIPSLVRACRQAGIPLINVSVIRHIGPNIVINIRNMRAKDGITLVQNTTQL